MPIPVKQVVPCFLVERTGQTRREPCGCHNTGCTVTREVSEWQRKDTGETCWGWPGTFGPGAIYIEEHGVGECFANWVNCNGKHRIAVLPNGSHWDMDSRASNCTQKQEGTHRCWVVSGEGAALTASKLGVTCAAGAGSIDSQRGKPDAWHGFLKNGVLQP